MLTDLKLLNILFSSTYNLIKFCAYLNLKLVVTYFLSVKFAQHRPKHFSYRDSVVRASLVGWLKFKSVLTFKSRRITLCTTSFNIQKFCVLPTMHLCVLRVSQNKQQFFSLYSINLSVSITEAESVYFAVRTGSLN